MSEEPKWVTYDQVVAIHSRQLRRFGGAPGLRDDGMLRSALERPVNKWQYEQADLDASDLDASDLATLAAAYAFGLAKNHAFVDGNKRAAFMTMVVFLRKNDVRFAPDQAHATAMMISLAAGEVSEQSLARWIRDNWPKS
jgi:death-on-curing protein